MAVHNPRALGEWVLEKCANQRFPYRLQVFRGDKLWFTLRVQDRWPAANRNIFCLREEEPPDSDDPLDEVERVPILAVQARGPRVSLILDRPRYKRCDFLFLVKTYKNRPAKPYEQIYWMTQAAMTQRRSGARLVSTRKTNDFMVRIASDERYPWRFPQTETERGRLPIGDYALMDGDEILAAVERKTLQNLLAEFGVMPTLHQRLLELASQEQHAFVVEAPYEDFVDPKKTRPYSASFCAAAIAQLYATHPRLRIVFCTNRKTANEWTRNYFAAVWKQRAEAAKSLVAERQAPWAVEA
jgi:hypothetical protein